MMNMRSRVRAATVALMTTFAGASCRTDVGTAPIVLLRQVRYATIAPDQATMSVGDTARLAVTLQDSAHAPLAGRRAMWSSSNPSAASVDSNGTVRARAPGAAIVAAVADNVRAEVRVTVQAVITEFSLSPAIVPLGSDPPLRATFRDAFGHELLVPAVLSLADTSLAYVPFNATPTYDAHAFQTKKMGKVLIVATALGREFGNTVQITDPVIDTLAPNLRAVIIPIGTSRPLDVRTIVQAGSFINASFRTVSYPLAWTSSNPAIVAVDTDGRITARAEGDAMVTASALGHIATIAVHAFRYPADHRAYTSVVAGIDRTCALDTAGAAYCWGAVGGSSFGRPAAAEIRNGLPGTGNLSPGLPLSTVPLPLISGLQFTSLASGPAYGQSCGFATDGETYCWMNDSAPARVQQPERFVSITVGAQHACGLASTGNAYCWGANESGQLGNGTTTAALVPQTVGGGLTFTSIAAGTMGTCGVATSGNVYCWGIHQFSSPRFLFPTPLRTSIKFRSVVLGESLDCGLSVNDLVYCWGSSLTPLNYDPDTRMASLGVGRSLICGLRTDGAAVCYKRPGGSFEASGMMPIAGDRRFRAFSVGAAACGIAADTYLYCFGENEFGQAGNMPVELRIRDVAFGEYLSPFDGVGVRGPARVLGQPE